MTFLAPGGILRNTLRFKGTVGQLHANFNRRSRRAGQNVSGDRYQQRVRILRPGAILLANLDIDETGVRTRFTQAQVDASNAQVDGGDDGTEVTLFRVAEPDPLPGTTASRIDLEIDPADARRVRIWRIPAENNPRGGGAPCLGPGVGASFTVIGHWLKSPDGWIYYFVAEALTLAGDPRLPAPAGGVPIPPGRDTPRPSDRGGSQRGTINARSDRRPIYRERGEGDVWLSLTHYDWDDDPIAGLADRGLLTIAPWIMTWNTLPCERVYVIYNNPNDDLGHNHGMVWDLQQACAAAGLRNPAPYAPSPDSTRPIPPNQRTDLQTGTEIPFYVIDGALVANDQWVQDEFEIGYCFAPHQRMHVVLHCCRRPSGNRLAIFVEDHMAHPGLGVFNSLARLADSLNFGGNLEVSPPVLRGTSAMIAGNAGPAVRAHRPAPFGKILLGDTAPRRCRADFRAFLQAQRVQPILPIDTSWLEVGHVDEILTFVRAPGFRGNGDYNFKLLFADFDALENLYSRVRGQRSQASLHAGKYMYDNAGAWQYDEQRVGTVLVSQDFTDSRWVQANKLTPILARLKTGLDLAAADVLPVPCYFQEKAPPPNRELVARTPGMVNMLVVNDHLLIPRPFGPRLIRAQATTAVGQALNDVFTALGLAVPATVIPGAPGGAGGDGLYYWARPGETLDNVAAYFVDVDDAMSPWRPRREFIHYIKTGVPVAAAYQADHANLRNAILGHAFNTGPPAAPTPINTACPAPAHTFNRWMRVWVPDGRVDVTEAFMHSILAPTGNTLHFIDDFECYHALDGEVHCGTNAKRSPPETLGGFTARWWNQDSYDAAYDTTY